MPSFLHHAAPLTLAAAIGQIQLITDRAIASLLAPGAISALRYGEVLVRTPITAIQSAWSSALYPALVRAGIDRTGGGLASATERSVRYMLVLFIPIAGLAAAVAPVAVEVAFGRGAFSSEDVAATARVVAAFAPLIVIWMVSPVLVGAHNARRHGRVLLAGATMNAILNFVLDVLFGASHRRARCCPIQLGELRRSSSSSSRTASRDRKTTFRPRRLGNTAVIASLATLPSVIIVAAICWTGTGKTGLIPGLLELVVLGSLGLAGYTFIATLLHLDEPSILAKLAAARLIGRFRAFRANG